MSETKICSECAREFVPSSRHAKCPRCRGRSWKQPCSRPGCKNLMNRDSLQCYSCTDYTSYGQSGENSAVWKGGILKTSNGYLKKLSPDHPKVQGKRDKYVFEHILVMEKELGRYLLPGENVHHKNGIREDNRLDNLELWVQTQPAGQRVSDLTDWAKELLSQYDKGFSEARESSTKESIRIIQASWIPNNWIGFEKRPNHAGYATVKYPGHPRAKKPNSYRIFEHILVMENVLERYLLPGENVHHRNGVRDDNRAENLELWVTPQPAGQRVSDLVNWARDIVNLYA